MAKTNEVTAAELLSRFFDDIREAEDNSHSSSATGDEVTRRCPGQDGATQSAPEAQQQSGPEEAHRHRQKPLDTAGPLPRHREDILQGSKAGSAPAARNVARGGAASQLRPGLLCRVGGRQSALWAMSQAQACRDFAEDPVAVAPSRRAAPARRSAGGLEGKGLGAVLADVEGWLAGEEAASSHGVAAAAGIQAAGQPSPAGFSDRFGGFQGMSSGRGRIYMGDAYNRQLQEEVNSTAQRQQVARRRPGGAPEPGDGDGDGDGDGKSAKGSGKGSMPRRVVLGGPLLPQELKPPLTHIHAMSYPAALQFSMFHSWQSHFGLLGPDAEEGENPRVRGLVSNSTPAILLCELNAIASFNMMDPILSYNYEFLMDTARLLHKRTPHGNGMPSRQPLGYVVQGAGPHLCPGGNHHPVSPPGGTPCSMHINSSSNPYVGNRECNLPSFIAMTGSVIGGGVALSLQQVHRAAASSCSVAFGNISRGACPVMFLSQNLPAAVGTLAAVEIYLTDGTFSACKCNKVGMVSQVLPSFVAVKTKAMQMSKAMASVPTVRMVNWVRPIMDMSRFHREAMGMTLAMRTGRLFANVKSARWRATTDDAERPRVAGADKDAGSSGLKPQSKVACNSNATSCNGHVVATTAPAVEVAASNEACTQCGQRNARGLRHGEAFFCSVCWPLLGIRAPSEAMARPSALKTAKVAACCDCRKPATSGHWGADDLWYCEVCWESWQAKASLQARNGSAEVPTDASTNHTDADSESEATIIGSDCVSCSDVWSDPED